MYEGMKLKVFARVTPNKSADKRVPEVNGGEAESYEEWDEWRTDAEVPGVRHSADGEEQESGTQHLVTSQHTRAVLQTEHCSYFLHVLIIICCTFLHKHKSVILLFCIIPVSLSAKKLMPRTVYWTYCTCV